MSWVGWRCQRCRHEMRDNPRFCPRCAYTVYEPIHDHERPEWIEKTTMESDGNVLSAKENSESAIRDKGTDKPLDRVSRADHVYRDGQWHREDTDIFDPTDDDPSLPFVTRLDISGWDDTMQVGGDEDDISLSVYERKGQYLIQVGITYGFEALLIVNSVPDLLDVLARWKPAVRRIRSLEVSIR